MRRARAMFTVGPAGAAWKDERLRSGWGWRAARCGRAGMKRTIVILAAASALLASPIRAETLSDDAPRQAGLQPVCLLARVSRQAASTRLCLSCHDGSLGSSHLAGPAAGSASGPGAHPVDVSYEDAFRRGRRLRPSFEVSRRLMLPDGKLTCVTCHDGASTERAHVAVTMGGSALCLGCHAA